MVMRNLVPLSALLLAAAFPAAAQNAEVQGDAAQAARVDVARKMVTAVTTKQPQEAITLADRLIGEYDRMHAGQKGRIYCDSDPAQTAGYATLAGGKDAVLVEGNWCMALWARGFAMIDLQQIDGAVPYLERAVAMAPLYPHYLSELGYAYQAQKKWQLSYDTYERAAKAALLVEKDEQQKKSLRRAWFGMAYGLIELGKLDEAEAYLRKCLEVAPGDQKILDELQYIQDERAKRPKA